MPIIYGNGFKPLKLSPGDVAKKRVTTGRFTLSLFERVLSAVGFIALSFIPVIGDAAAVAEASISAGETEALATAAQDILTTAAAEGTEVGSLVSLTANTLKLGQTVKGSVSLGLGEAIINTGIDVQDGNVSAVNEILNFGLAFTPLIGIRKGRRTASIRLVQRAEEQIAIQKELLINAGTGAERVTIETRIRQLENIKLIKSSRLFDANISSDVSSLARSEILRIVERNGDQLGDFLKVNNLANDVRNALIKNDIRISRREAKALVKFNSKDLPSVIEGVSVSSIAKSKTYNRIIEGMRWADPNLATRKVWTKAAHFLTTDEPLLKIGEKTIIGGKKINLGYYQKFGRKLSRFWRSWGKKIYRASRVKMIPVVSKWIEGYRLIDTPVPGEYVMIVIFKPSSNGRIPQPRVISPVSLETALEFAEGVGYGGSPGSFYINRFALARNGSGATVVSGIASVLGPVPLGELRQILAGPASFERLVRDFSKGNYTQQWIDGITETTSRLWVHKLGKVLAGRWGIAVARGFQKTSHGHTYLQSRFDFRYLIDEVGVVTLDKARSVQRKSGIQGRSSIVNGKRVIGQYKRTVKLMTFGYVKFDGKTGFKKGKGMF